MIVVMRSMYFQCIGQYRCAMCGAQSKTTGICGLIFWTIEKLISNLRLYTRIVLKNQNGG